jgi:3-deoxy-manno-octulosonate cytidylyltransferase (CMP-KDO synthetase)
VFHIVIPARYGSTRLPGKALADIAGEPMLYWVWQRALAAGAQSVTIATDDDRIASVLRARGAEVVMTRADHPSGTDRLAEVVNTLGFDDDAIIVNLQGDEPLMPAANLRQVAALLEIYPDSAIATLAESINDLDTFHNPAAVKVVVGAHDRALYFSRAPIPWPREAMTDPSSAEVMALRHIGLYAYRSGFLRRFIRWGVAPSEALESLEQLRALHHGEVIRVERASEPVPAGVDTAADLEAVRALMAEP